MILDYNQMMSDGPFGRDIFFGKIEESPEMWKSTLPFDMQRLVDDIAVDPRTALQGATSDELKKIEEDVRRGKIPTKHMKYFVKAIANTALYNVVNASRQMIGMAFRTVGILSNSFGIVRNLFKEEASVALRLTDLVGEFVKSDFFEMALNAIGLIPVVGWIIKIVVEVAQSVAKIVTVIFDDNLKTAKSVAAQQLSIPMRGTEFSKMADDAVVQEIYGRMRDYDQQRFIQPAYAPMGGGGEYLGFTAQGVYDDDWDSSRGDKEMGLGWVVQPGKYALPGLGFVPGTGNITRSMFFPAGVTSGRGCKGGAVRDIGSLYPTGGSLLSSWWSMVLKPGPSMFSVDAKQPIKDWENYIYGMLMLGPNVMKGWACAPTGIPFSNKFYCVDGMMGKGNKKKRGVGDCRWGGGRRGKVMTLPKDFGRSSHVTLMGHLYSLFFGLKKLSERGKSFNPDLGIGIPKAGKVEYYKDHYGKDWLNPDSVDISESVPVRALENLYERQMFTLKSINCMYVDGEKSNRHRFPSFNNRKLRDQWYESVTAIMSSNDWRQVVFADVPESRMKNELLKVVKRNGLDPDKLNDPRYRNRQMHIRAAPTVLGSPTLPPPPGAVRVTPSRVARMAEPSTKRKAKKKSQSGTIIAAAAVAGLLLLKK